MDILLGCGPLGSGPTGPGSGFSVMPYCISKSSNLSRSLSTTRQRSSSKHSGMLFAVMTF